MAKYFVGCLIQGEAAEWHTRVAKDISDKFGTWKIFEKIPPHVTVYRPFDTDNIQPVLDVLENWSKNQRLNTSLAMSGFDRFDDKVVFAKLEINPTIEKSVLELKQKLKEIPNMPQEDYPTWHPHATLAYMLTSKEINDIWDYVLTLQKPKFVLPFDNIALFASWADRTWKVEKLFKIQ